MTPALNKSCILNAPTNLPCSLMTGITSVFNFSIIAMASEANKVLETVVHLSHGLKLFEDRHR